MMNAMRCFHFISLDYWKDKCVMLVMSHNKCGLPLVRGFLGLGMYVIAVSRYKNQSEYMRGLLNEHESQRFITREVDLHSVLNIQHMLKELSLTVETVHLLIMLLPKISMQESNILFEPGNESILQSVMEIDDLSAEAFISFAKRILLHNNPVWVICFNHKQANLVWEYLQNLIKLGEGAEREIKIHLARLKRDQKIHI
uniref:Uncharacterized protein n=1 Tax=Glossina austeni TaxID=7395 RepID=A0A1A9VRA4_GLOAU